MMMESNEDQLLTIFGRKTSLYQLMETFESKLNEENVDRREEEEEEKRTEKFDFGFFNLKLFDFRYPMFMNEICPLLRMNRSIFENGWWKKFFDIFPKWTTIMKKICIFDRMTHIVGKFVRLEIRYCKATRRAISFWTKKKTHVLLFYSSSFYSIFTINDWGKWSSGRTINVPWEYSDWIW